MISNFKDLNVYFKSFEDRDDNLSQIRGLAVHFLFFFLLDAVRKKYFDTLVRKRENMVFSFHVSSCICTHLPSCFFQIYEQLDRLMMYEYLSLPFF